MSAFLFKIISNVGFSFFFDSNEQSEKFTQSVSQAHIDLRDASASENRDGLGWMGGRYASLLRPGAMLITSTNIFDIGF